MSRSLNISRVHAVATNRTPVPHRGDDDDDSLSASEDVVYDGDGDGFAPTGIELGEATVVVNDVRKRARENGIPREDGDPRYYGAGNDRRKRFGDEYIERRVQLFKLLEKNDDYKFAKLVQGNLNVSIDELIDTGDIDAGLKRAIARAKEVARERRASASSIESLRKTLADVTAELDRLKQAESAAARNLGEWTLTASRLPNLVDEFKKKMELVSVERFSRPALFKATLPRNEAGQLTAASLAGGVFELLTRTAVMRYSRGVLDPSFARDFQSWFQAYVPFAIGRESDLAAKAAMETVFQNLGPQTATLAIQLATLRSATDPPGRAVGFAAVAGKEGRFEEKSAYSAAPETYANDLTTLVSILMPENRTRSSGTSNLFTYERVSIALIAHLNLMIRNSGIAVDPLRSPIVVNDAPRANRRGRGRVLGGDVDLDLADDDLERAAAGDDEGFTEEQLRVIRQNLYENADVENVRMALLLLLAPLFAVAFGRMFYNDVDEPSSDLKDLLDEGGLPAAGSFASTYKVFGNSVDARDQLETNLFPALPEFAFLLLRQAAAADPAAARYTRFGTVVPPRRPLATDYDGMAELLFARLVLANDQWAAYRKRVRRRLFERLLVPTLAGVALVGSTTLEDDNLTESDEAVLRAEIQAGKTREPVLDDAAYQVLTERVSADGAAPVVADVAETKSEQIALGYADAATKLEIEQKLNEKLVAVRSKKSSVQKTATELNDKITGQLLKTPEAEAEEIEKNIANEYEATLAWAMRPENSGVLQLRAKFVTALENAFTTVTTACKNLEGLSQATLQRHEATRAPYARLVAAHLRLTELNNPTSYQSSHSYQQAYNQMTSAVAYLKRAVVELVPRQVRATPLYRPSSMLMQSGYFL